MDGVDRRRRVGGAESQLTVPATGGRLMLFDSSQLSTLLV